MRWVPASSLQAFKDKLDGLVQGWASDWGVQGIETSAACLDNASQRNAAQDPAWISAHPAAGSWRSDGAEWSDALAIALFGVSAQDSAIAKHVGRKAAAALAARLDAFAEVSECTAVEPEQGAGLPGHWGVHYTARLANGGCAGGAAARLEVTASTAWLEARAWIQVPAKRPLKPRAVESAIAGLPVRLRVELGVAELSLGDLTALSLDDVLLCRTPITAPLRVVSLDGNMVARGYLGRAGAQRALQMGPALPGIPK